MPRPNESADRRRALLPIIARTFAECGYRRATTAELAGRCRIPENVLYRLWPEKKAMFIAAIGYVYELSAATWARLLTDPAGGPTHAERILAHEARHHGEFSHYRIVFAGLTEADDPDVRAALADMFQRFTRLLEREIRAHRESRAGGMPDAALAAWAVVGLGTIANIVRELGLFDDRQRSRFIAEVGHYLLDGRSGPRRGLPVEPPASATPAADARVAAETSSASLEVM